MQFLLTSQQRAFRARQRGAVSSTILAAATLSMLPVGESAFGVQDRDRSRTPAAGDLVNDQNQPVEPIVTMWPEARRLVITDEGDIAGTPSATFLNSGSLPEADGPDDVVYTPDGNTVLVVHRDTDNVTFLDVNTRSVTHTVTVGDFPLDVAVTPNGQKAVVANALSHNVSIIDIATHAVVATVPVTGQQPFRVQITPDSQFAVVALINDAVNSAFSVINLTTNTESSTIPSSSQGVIGGFFTPESGISGPILTQFALTPDGNTIVLPLRLNAPDARVNLYSRATGALLQSIPVAGNPTSVDISADSTTAVIGHDSPGNAITEIDIPTQTVTGSFPLGATVLSGQVIRITPDKNHAIAGISNNVIFVNLTTGAVDATINTGVVGEIEISHDGQFAFVSNFTCRVIDIATRTQVGQITFAACVEAACSPTQLRAVALNSRFREDIHFYSINGAASSLEGFASTGPLPEADATRDLALSPDGNTLIACNNTSRNIALIDVPSSTVEAYIEVGERPLGAAITPNGQYAVVCATDSHMVRIIDLSSNAIVSSLTINQRPVQVRISPDSQFAYVLNVAGTDAITFIQLNGAASSILSQVTLGLQTGSAQGYAYTETSGIELSDDGSLLGVADSFNDFLRLYDTATRTQIAQVPVGDFPMRVAFNPTGTRAYVTNAFGDSVSVVNVAGAASSVIATIPTIEFPLTVNVDAAGAFAYVGNTNSTAPAIHVIDATSNTQVSTIPLTTPARETHLDWADNVLYAVTNGSTTITPALVRINAAGAASTIIDTTPLSAGPSDMVVDNADDRAFAAQPIPDGVDIVAFGVTPCPADIRPAGAPDGVVDVNDLLAVITTWGACPDCPSTPCDADIAPVGPPTGNCTVDVNDLLLVITTWGPCP
jgi:YVTN family beta-propeller protein